MVQYVGPDGTVYQNRPWSLRRLVDGFWGIIGFVVLFLRTLTEPILGALNSGANSGRRGGGGGGGNSDGPSGPGGPGRGGPGKKIGRIATISDCTIPGGG